MVNLLKAARNLDDFRAVGLCRIAGLPQIVDFISIFHACGNNPDGMDIPEKTLSQNNILNFRRALQGVRHPFRTGQHRSPVQG